MKSMQNTIDNFSTVTLAKRDNSPQVQVPKVAFQILSMHVSNLNDNYELFTLKKL